MNADRPRGLSCHDKTGIPWVAVTIAALFYLTNCHSALGDGQVDIERIDSGSIRVRWAGHDAQRCEVVFSQTGSDPLLRSIGVDLDYSNAITDEERFTINASLSFHAVNRNQTLEAKFADNSWNVTRLPWGVTIRRDGVTIGPLKGTLTYDILPGSSFVPCVLELTSATKVELTGLEHRLRLDSTRNISRIVARKWKGTFDATNNEPRDLLDKPLASALHDKSLVVSTNNNLSFAITMPPHYWWQCYPQVVDGPFESGMIRLPFFDCSWRRNTSIEFAKGARKRFICLYYLGDEADGTYLRLCQFLRNGKYPHLPEYQVFSTHNHGTVAQMKQLARVGVNIALWNNYGHELTKAIWQQQLDAIADLSAPDFRIIPSAETSDGEGAIGRLLYHMNYVTPEPVLIRGAEQVKDASGSVRYDPVAGEEGAELRARLATQAGGLAWLNHPMKIAPETLVNHWTHNLFALEWNTYADVHKYNNDNRFDSRFERRFFDRYEALLNSGRKIYVIAGTDDHEMTYIYQQGVVNYVRMQDSSVPHLIDTLRNGDFFITTGEILIASCTLNGVRSGETLHMGKPSAGQVAVTLEWTYPLRSVKVISNCGVEVEHRAAVHQEFGEGDFQFRVPLEGRTWLRVEVWDIANNLAFTQPFFIARRPNIDASSLPKTGSSGG